MGSDVYHLLPVRLLQSVLDRLDSFEAKRGQAEAQLAELHKNTSSLPRVFSWPGLGERRQALEHARTLQNQITAMGPVLSDLHTEVRTPQVVVRTRTQDRPS